MIENKKPKTVRKKSEPKKESAQNSNVSSAVPTKDTATEKKTEQISSLPPIEFTKDYNINDYELDFDNEVYDEVDIASALEMGFIAKALEAHKSKVAPETHPDFDGESCIDCGDDIPQVRLNMGKIRCVYCQEALEKKNKLHGR